LRLNELTVMSFVASYHEAVDYMISKVLSSSVFYSVITVHCVSLCVVIRKIYKV
jgi:hypothetical protein